MDYGKETNPIIYKNGLWKGNKLHTRHKDGLLSANLLLQVAALLHRYGIGLLGKHLAHLCEVTVA